MVKSLKIFLTGCIVSLFLYSFSFNGLPINFNTKNILAVLGLLVYIKEAFFSEFYFRKDFAIATLFVLFFSSLCLFSVYFNGTYEINSYTIYFRSFFIWFFSAKFVVTAIKLTHKECSIVYIAKYLAYVSAIQCILAIIIDRNELVKMAVDSVVFQGQEFLNDVDRLYGIGCYLDIAGVKFAITLILIAFVINNSFKTMSKASIFGLVVCYIIISSIGNMISRTTTTGLVLSLIVFILGSGIISGSINIQKKKIYSIILPLFALSIFLGIYLYNTDDFFYSKFRYGFEGFFNWVEKGEWTTGSTEKLNSVMWIWPSTLNEWIIGTGRFDNFAFATDIGYCRLILFSGLLSFIPFSLFFIYNGVNFAKMYHKYRFLFLIFILMTFVIWIKVSTDIFFIYALFYNFVDKGELQNTNT